MSSAVDEYDLTAADQFQAPSITTSPPGVILRMAHTAPFLLSFAVHLGGRLVGLAIYGVAGTATGGRFMMLASPTAQPVHFESLPEITDIRVESNLADTAAPVAAINQSGDVGESLPAPLSVVSDNGARQLGNSPLDDVMGLFQGNGDGFGDNGQGKGGAEFFGVKAAGKRFVFVVDSSRSMRGRKWSKACRELIASVNRLNPSQSFFVIFFDVDTHPMFSQKKPERDLIPVTSKNQRKLLRWLPSIKLGPDTRPLHSMQLALGMKPDAIFLLSDGEFNDGTRDFLIDENHTVDDAGVRSPKIPIHAVGFHSLAAEASLRPIAADNGGTYRFVPR